MKCSFNYPLCIGVILMVLTSCGSYKKNILLKPSEVRQPDVYQQKAGEVVRDYVIQKNDLLEMMVYSNRGEKLIDPLPELATANDRADTRKNPQYIVDENGVCKLPMIGDTKLDGLSLRKAEELIQESYAQFFKEPFVQLKYANKRVVVLGAMGGHVVPLTNPGTRLAEVLAVAKGPTNDTQVQNIRVVRGEDVYQVNLSTIEGFQAGNMVVEPGDVIYAEPVRRPFTEGLRDNGNLLTILVSILTLVVVFNQTR